MPFALWSWAEEIGAPATELAAWRRADIRAELDAALPWPVYLQNDATAACGAELAFGRHAGLQDFVYFYVGAFIGGGLVLNGGLFAGRTGNAAALGSMPVPDGAGGSEQLIDVASLVLLERRLRAKGLPLDVLYDPDADWGGYGADLEDWLAGAARHRPRGRGGLGDHRLRGGGDRRRLPARVRAELLRQRRRRARPARPLRHRAAGSPPRQHRPDRPRPRRRQPAAVRPLSRRPARSRRARVAAFESAPRRKDLA